MNKLPRDKKIQVINCLVEGVSIRSTVRMTGVAKNTVTKLLVEIGTACQKYHDEHVKNVTSKRVQCDEIWSFVYAKQKNASEEMKAAGTAGDVWTWTAIDADSKLMISYLVGNRDADSALAFMQDVQSRLANRVQLTTDGHKPYLEAVDSTFGIAIDYAQLVKHYGTPVDGTHRYSPAECTGAQKNKITGNPDEKHVSTSFVERSNLTIRMGIRRFTRLTNAFSKKVENHAHHVALHFMHYNYVRIHSTLRVTPAMEAGLTKKLWEIGDLVDLIG